MRVDLLGTGTLRVKFFAGACQIRPMGLGPLLQSRCLSGFGVGFGLRSACLVFGFLSERFSALDLLRDLVYPLANLLSVNRTALVSATAQSPRQDSENQQCQNYGDDDDHDGGGIHVELLC